MLTALLMARCPATCSSARSSLGIAHTPGSWPREYFERFPKELYQTEFESWRELQSQNIEFTMKRLREPIERATEIAK